MNAVRKVPERFFLLVDRYCSAMNSADEASELETLLRDNRAAERYFLDHCHLQAQLYQQHATSNAIRDGLQAVIDQESLLGRRESIWNSIRQVVVTNLAASLMIAGLAVTVFVLSMALWTVPKLRPANTGGVDMATAEFVARISETSQATFDATSDGNLRNRDLFDDDTIVLNSGLAVIEYDTGARVVLEGPATFHVAGTNGGDLRVGKVAANVPKSAHGFAIATPFATVTDLGTEFGILVGDDATDVAVYQGEVRMDVPDTGGQRRSIRLTAGSVGQANRAGELKRLAGETKELAIVRELPREVAVASDDRIQSLRPDFAGSQVLWRGRVAGDLRSGRREADALQVFVERLAFPIPATITVDMKHSGKWDPQTEPGSLQIQGGKRVDVYLLHYDPIDRADRNMLTGEFTLRFDRPIVGVVAFQPALEVSDKIFGRGNVTYPVDRGVSGLERGGSDLLQIDPDGQTLRLTLVTGNAFVDQLRVLVEAKASPE